MANNDNVIKTHRNGVSIDYITDWKAGELLTEYKLKAIFEVIGNAINGLDETMELYENAVNSLRIALRWIGAFDTYEQYQEWELQHRGDPQFQKPNDPLPSAGDIILINDSSTMPEGSMPAGVQQGRYLFIYVQQYDFEEGQVVKHGWELYNPLALPNASRVNDGLMSKEMYIKLDDLKPQGEINEIITNFEERISTNTQDIKVLKPKVETNISNISKINTKISQLETNKQDKTTDIANYKTKTVVDNLQEVKTKVDSLASELSQVEITIWQPEEPITKLTEKNRDVYVATFDFEAEDTKFLTDSYIRTYLEISNINDPGNEHVVSITMKNTKQSDSKFTAIGTESMYMHGASNDETCEVSSWLSKRAEGQYTLHVEVKPENNIPNTNYSVQFDKLIKDLGVSDYMMAEKITEDLQDFLKGAIGLKRKIVTSKPNGDTIFQPGDMIDLGFDFLPNSNAVVVFQGGTKLTQNVIWEEVPGVDEFKSNKIKFLKEVDLSKDGELEITAASVILNSYQVKYWNNEDTFVKGEVVYYNGRMYFCKVTNVNKQPDTMHDYWELLQFEIDLENLEARIKEYVYSISLEQAVKAIETHDKGNSVYFLKNEISEYKTRADLRDTISFLQKNKAFILSESGEKTYVTFENVNSLIEDVVHQDPGYGYVVKWLDTIYATQLADVKVLQATPQEVSAEVKAQLAHYEQGIPTEYADTVQVFSDVEAYNRFKAAHNLTDEDFVDVTPPTTDISQLATKQEVGELRDHVDTELSSKISRDQVETNYLNLKTTQVQQVQGQTNFNSEVRLANGLVLTSSGQEAGSIKPLYDTTNSRYGLTIRGAVDFASTDVKAAGQPIVLPNKENTFTQVNTFKRAVNVDGSGGIYFRDNNGKNSLNIFSPGTVDGHTLLTQYSSSTATAYVLRAGGPTQGNDLVHKQYVDDAIARVSLPIPTNMVTTDTAQTITGVKTFNDIRFGSTSTSSDSIQIRPNRIDFNGSSDIYGNGTGNYIYGNWQVSANMQFNILPTSSVTPTSNNQLVNKAYVDNKVAGVVTPGANNEFTGINTFNGQTKFTNQIFMKNNNGIGFQDENNVTLGFITTGATDGVFIQPRNTAGQNMGSGYYFGDTNNVTSGNQVTTKTYVDNNYTKKIKYLNFSISSWGTANDEKINAGLNGRVVTFVGRMSQLNGTIRNLAVPPVAVANTSGTFSADEWYRKVIIDIHVSEDAFIIIRFFKFYDENSDTTYYKKNTTIRFGYYDTTSSRSNTPDEIFIEETEPNTTTPKQ